MRSALVLAVCLLAAPIHAQVPEAVDPAQIPAYRVIAPGIVAAGQPAAEMLPKLAAMGFKTVLNLRMPDEGGPANEQGVVESQGLRYVSVPVGPGRFGLAEVESVEKVIADPAAGPILFHCASSNRVGAAWAGGGGGPVCAFERVWGPAGGGPPPPGPPPWPFPPPPRGGGAACRRDAVDP